MKKDIVKESGSGITIGDETLEEYVGKRDWVDKSVISDAEEESRETKKIIYKGGKLRYERKDRSGRTRYLTDREIREEYGLMEKGFPTTVENVIWAIFHKQPITVKQIGKEIGWGKSTSSLSAQMKGIWDRLGVEAQIIERKPVKGGPGFTYSVKEGVDMTVEAAIQRYKATSDPRNKKSKKKNRINEILEIPEEVAPIKKVMSERINQQLGMKVEVTGKVEVIFRFIVGRD